MVDRQHLIEHLVGFGECHPARNTDIFSGKRVLNMVFYLKAAALRGLNVQEDMYYVFMTDKGEIIECCTPKDAIDKAFDNPSFDYNEVKIGDYVDFGMYGRYYVCGENIDGTKFLVTVISSQRAKRADDSLYLEKKLAKSIIEKYYV